MSRSIRSVHALHRPISERYTVRGRGEYLRISPEDGLVVPRLSLLHYRSSLLDPRSSGRNKSHGTLLKMAQTNQLPVRQRTEDRGNENSRPEKDPQLLVVSLRLHASLVGGTKRRETTQVRDARISFNRPEKQP